VISARRVEPADRAALAKLFEGCASSCHCRYWLFDGDKNAWLARCAQNADENERELAHEIESEALVGVVGFDDAELVGWMRLTERRRLPKLTALPVYRALDLGDANGVASVACFLVHPAHRKRGVARVMLRAAIELVHSTHIVEAYPRHAGTPLSDEEAWLGPERLFTSEGFSRATLATRAPALFDTNADAYPIYRRPRRGDNDGRA
jgi:GNAT superfamily N-acetyltransferase